MKAFVRFILTLFVVVLILSMAVVGAALYFNQPAQGIPADGVAFSVQRGETVGFIAANLQEGGLIRSGLMLRIYSKIVRTENLFKTGTYLVTPGMTLTDIHELIIAGKQILVRVTIPEGWTINKIGKLLEEEGICNGQEFIDLAYSAAMVNDLNIPGDSVEGYLFPDTYLFPEQYPAESVIRGMVEHFFSELEAILPDYKNLKRKTLHESIVLASIIEREYRLVDEAPLISSVFKNRMKYNIGLESCATLEYIITEIQGKPHPKIITLDDTKINSVYNTYKWAGLPPGPISNPGRVALSATFHSAETDFYYFVLKDPQSGSHYFSGDLAEHNQAKVFYLKGFTGSQ